MMFQIGRARPRGGSSDLQALLVAGLGLACLFPGSSGALQSGCDTERVSVGPGGVQANSQSSIPVRGVCVSADCRWVGFSSSASNLVVGDKNGQTDAFVRDRFLGVNILVSVSSAGEQGDSSSSGTTLSADGRFAAFDSWSTNLVPGDTNLRNDCFVRDLWTGRTERVSVSSTGEEGASTSYDGRISADGRFVAFVSPAANLVPGDFNHRPDIFVRDRLLRTTVRVSVSSTGVEANGASSSPSISGNGRFVAFDSLASNLVPGNANAYPDVFVHDLVNGTTVLVNVSSSGVQGNGDAYRPAISSDGGYVAFESVSTNLVPGDTNDDKDIFVHELASGQTTRVNLGPGGVQANSDAARAAISADGRFVCFESVATNLVSGGSSGTEIFVHDRWNGTTSIASVNSSGIQGNGPSYNGSLSPDGQLVVFQSYANNLVPGDTNPWQDVFARDCGGGPGLPRIYCMPKTNSLGCMPAIAFSGSASASAGTGFDISASGVLGQKPGLLIYSLSGPSALVFQGGWLCVQAPLVRTPPQLSAGSSGTCSGAYTFDFNAWIASGADPALVAGQDVWAQYWSRDPGFAPPDSTGLTDALAFSIGP
jgi:Tol biopolymer transport system component